jgi:hypothetical protein
MSPLVSILYICDPCQRIRLLDLSQNNLEPEGELYKVKDVHTDHEATLFLNAHFIVERIIFDPPLPLSEDPVVKGLKVTERASFEGDDRIFVTTRDPTQMVLLDGLQIAIASNINGVSPLGDIYEKLSPDYPDFTHEYLLSFISKLAEEQWIREK